jgi:hypothetical protein
MVSVLLLLCPCEIFPLSFFPFPMQIVSLPLAKPSLAKQSGTHLQIPEGKFEASLSSILRPYLKKTNQAGVVA